MKVLLLVFPLLAGSLALAGEPSVTVHLLDHTDKKKTKTRFWIDWSNSWRGIVETKTVSGEKAAEIIKTLRANLSNAEAMHFCGHDPIYGIQAKDEDDKVLKTSLCFTCLTWVKPKLRLEISGERGANNVLCKALRGVIELPPELLKEDSKPIESGAANVEPEAEETKPANPADNP